MLMRRCGAIFGRWAGVGLFLIVALQASLHAENRFLLVVETARANQPQLPAAQLCIQDLLRSQMDGQLRAGDTLGVWTYNTELHAGNFPLQRWRSDQRVEIARRVDGFLSAQDCRGAGRIATVLPDLLTLVTNSPTLTVLLFSDGFEPVQGTPFDDAINQAYAAQREKLRAEKSLFVTVLQAREGALVGCTVNAASGPVHIPALPPATNKPVELPAAKVEAPPPPAVVYTTNAPLILDYSHKAAAPDVSPGTPAPATATNDSVAAIIAAEAQLAESKNSATNPALTPSANVPLEPSHQPPVAVAVPATVSPATTAPSAAAVAPAAAPGAPDATATADRTGRWGLILAAAALLLGGLVLVLWLRGPTPRSSAITESMNQRKR